MANSGFRKFDRKGFGVAADAGAWLRSFTGYEVVAFITDLWEGCLCWYVGGRVVEVVSGMNKSFIIFLGGFDIFKVCEGDEICYYVV